MLKPSIYTIHARVTMEKFFVKWSIKIPLNFVKITINAVNSSHHTVVYKVKIFGIGTRPAGTIHPTRIAPIRRAAPRIGIRLLGLGQQGVYGEELLGRGVVVAGAQVLQAGGGIGVLAGVAEGRGGAGLGEDHAVGIVGGCADDAAGAVGQGADAAQLVGGDSVGQVQSDLFAGKQISP